jgi:hypothetical protein
VLFIVSVAAMRLYSKPEFILITKLSVRCTYYSRIRGGSLVKIIIENEKLAAFGTFRLDGSGDRQLSIKKTGNDIFYLSFNSRPPNPQMGALRRSL